MEKSDGQLDQHAVAPDRSAVADLRGCPTLLQLEQFVFGKLPEWELALVGEHTDQCPQCQSMLTTLEEKQDVLLRQLRFDLEPQVNFDQVAATLNELPAVPLSQNANISDEPGRLRRLVRRLEKLADVKHSNPSRDWMQWLRSEFDSTSAADSAIRVGDFRIESVVGVGGMGIVFDAFDERLQRRVALKFMRPEIATTTRVRERFSIEARAMAIVSDPHVVKIFQVGQIGALPYLTMEFLEGEPLGHRLRQGPACSVTEVVQIGAQVAAGLAAAHRCGLIHRDVKPDNIFLTADSVKLLDFGLARSVAGTSFETNLEEADWVLGTPAFMSPEQAQALAVDERTDLFSLGCVLYRLLTGKLPFDGATHQELMRARMTQSPMSLHVVAPHLPLALTGLIDQLLARDPQRRPATASEVALRLRSLAPRPRRRLIGRRTLLAAGVIAATGAAVGGWRWWEAVNRIEPLDPEWLARVKRLKVDAQVKDVVAEMSRRNPKWDGEHVWDHRQQTVFKFDFDSQHVRDISPLQAFDELKELVCRDHAERRTLVDVSPLRGLQLAEFNAGSSGLRDLSPLQGMPLGVLRLSSSRVADLTPLAAVPLKVLQLAKTLVEDLSPIRECPLQLASFWETRVSSLEPLRGIMTLNRVECEKTLVRDLSPLRGLPIKHLACQGSPIEDYSILAELPLEELHLSYRRELHRDLLLSIKTLKRVNYKPVDVILR